MESQDENVLPDTIAMEVEMKLLALLGVITLIKV